jgi:THO complex subunit 2
VVQAAASAQSAGDGLTLAVVFHEIIEAAIDGLMPSSELGSMVRDIVAAPSDESIDPVSTFLDTLSSLTHDEKKHVLVRHMLVATEIDVSRMRAELDNDLLKALNLVRDSFPKMAVRKATHALYRQSNYNLLREETEGYSKLMTEYFTTVNNEPPSHDVVSETYERVNALIGAFDLDIGRVLDVTLDVFANLLVKHGKFFVKLLRSSAWWPEQRGLEGIEWQEPDVSTLPSWAEPGSALWYHSEQEKEEQLQSRERRDRKFWQRVGELEAQGGSRGIEAFFELGARRITANNRPIDPVIHAEGAQLSKQQAARKWADDWMSETGTLPPFGNDIAAQLLGFKLRFYASDTRDASDFLPDNLIYLAALLIKVGFISILDLYPHLYPAEPDMAAHKRKLLKEKKDREAKESGRVGNALTMSSALPDEMPPGPPVLSRLRDAEGKTSSKPDSERSTPSKSEEATDAKPALPEPADQKFQLLKSLLCIGALPEAFFILGRHPWLLEVYPDLRDCLFRLAHHSLSKVYEAARPIPSEETFVVPKGAGSRAPSRPSDFIPRRTLRWAKPDQRDAGDGIDYRFYWEDWVDNVPVCHEVDDVIKLCTTLLALVGPECGKDILLLTKLARIARKDLAENPSETNRKRWIDFSATFLAPALSFTGQNPGIVNEVWELLKQFDTATRYTIYESWFELRNAKPAMRAMFDTMRKDTNALLNKVTAINTKEYGRKIAKLSYSNPGLVFRNTVTRLIGYPNMIDALVECSKYLTLLGYDCLTWTLISTLTNPSKEGKKDDGMFAQSWLTNLSLFIGKAYQKYPLMDPTPVLQYTTHQLLQTDGELYMLDVLEQMIKWMGGIGLVGSLSEPMVFSLCGGPVLRTFTLQHHLSDTRHLSGTSARRLAKCVKDRGLAPQILVALAQHVEAFIHREDQLDTPDKVVFYNSDKLRSNLFQYLEFLRAYVSVEEFDEAFPSLVEMISEFNVDPTIAFTVCRASIAAKANAFRAEKQTKASVSQPTSPHGDVAMEEADEAADAPEPLDAQNLEIKKVVDDLTAALPGTFTGHPCLSFYVTFWQLSLPDVDNDGIKQRYRETISHFERQLVPVVNERRGYNNPNIPRKETTEMRRAREEISKLKKEQQAFEKTNSLTQDQLRVEMLRWFDNVPMLDSKSDALHNALLQDCFIPRSRMSLQDAQFASSMLRFMHSSGVPGFRTIKLLDNLFLANKLTCIISMYSEEESKSFGRFLNDVLRELQKWHDNKDDAYAKYAHGLEKNLPGFGRRFDADRNPTELLSYDDFCKLLYKWHKALFVALKTCIESGKFTEIRNSISILSAISSNFPKVDTMSEELRLPLENIAKNDERDDLKILAQSTFKVFKKSKNFWSTEWDFRNVSRQTNLTCAPFNNP